MAPSVSFRRGITAGSNVSVRFERGNLQHQSFLKRCMICLSVSLSAYQAPLQSSASLTDHGNVDQHEWCISCCTWQTRMLCEKLFQWIVQSGLKPMDNSMIYSCIPRFQINRFRMSAFIRSGGHTRMAMLIRALKDVGISLIR